MNKKNYSNSGKARVLLNLLSDAAAMIDGKGNFLVVNDAFEGVTGLSRKELIGTPFFKINLLASESKTVLLENLKKRMQGTPVDPYEVVFTDKLGEKRWVEVKGRKVSYAGHPSNLVVFHDVTRRKENERWLKEYSEQMEALVEEKVKEIKDKEEKYRKLFEESIEAIFVADAETGIIVDCNRAASEMVGRKKSELVGKHQSIITPKEQMDGEFARVFKQHLKDPTKILETQIIRKTGEIRNVAVRDSIFELKGKKLMQGTFRDITDLKEAEQTIKETKERYRELVDALPEIVFEADLTGKLTFFNRTTFKTTGYTQVDLEKGLNMLQVVVPEQRERAVENIKKTLTESGGEPHEYTLIRRDGSTYPALVKTAPIFSGNKVTGLRGFLFDITERNKNEQILKASEEKFRNLAENSPNMIFIYQKGKVVYVNKEAERAMGYTKEEFYSSEFNFLDIITPEDRELVVTNFVKHTKGEDTAPYEYGLINKDGSRIDAILNTKIITCNEEPGILGIVTDITERKCMQNILEESEEKFRTITNSVRDAIIMVDNEAKVASWNPAAEKTFGYTKMEAIGKKVHELIVPKTMNLEGREYIKIGVQQFANKGSGAFTNGNIELIGCRKDGTEFPVKLSITPIKLQGKWSAVGVVKDITDRKQAEQKLQEAEKRYHALFNEAPLGVLVVDPQTEKPVEFNEVAHVQLGYSREEFSKVRISDFEAKEKTGETYAHVAKMLKQGGDEFETEHRTKNGDIRNVLVNAKAVELDNKTFLHCIFHDITEIRKVQEALMKSETQYRQLVNVAQEGIWAFDSHYCTVFVNPRTVEMLGYSESEMVGKSIFNFLDKRDVEEAKQFLSQFEQGAKGSFEYEFPRKDGSRFYANITASALKDDKGQSIGILALVSDITERKKKELELGEERNKFEALAQSVGAGFVVVNKDYHILWANKFIKDYKGDVEGKLCYSTLNDLDHICPDCGVKKVFENGANSDAHEYSSTDIKGNPYWVELIATPIKDSDGKVISAAEIAVDITEKKKMQSKLAEYSHRLEKLVEERTKQLKETQAQLVKSERLAAIGELAGMVGHDLRNPLSGIKNAAYFLKKKGATIPESQAKDMLEIIDKAIDHSDKIINDLLEYAREMHLELEKYEAHTLVDEAIRMIKVPDRIQIVNEVQEDTWVWVNADKIMRVFINLIKNAIEAMPENGKLEITSRQARDKVEIAFADTGTGIPEEILKKIFTPLVTTKAQGMGFGLAICKRIIEAHGGTIAVETAVNKGTTFTVTLPFKPTVEVGDEKTWVNMPESLLLTTTKTQETR